jgi:hypothetical protein
VLKLKFSFWHPIGQHVEDCPLALCDYSSVNLSEDLVAADFFREQYKGEQWYAKYNPMHRWYFVSKQQLDEGWVFKIFDSQEEGTSRCKYPDIFH